jgi:hypothetical protein
MPERREMLAYAKKCGLVARYHAMSTGLFGNLAAGTFARQACFPVSPFVRRREAERTNSKASIENLETTLTRFQQRVAIRKQQCRKEFGSKIQY